MNSGEKDRVWIFAATLFAIVLLAFSKWILQSTNPRSQVVEAQAVDDVWPVKATIVPVAKTFDREFVATAYSGAGVTKSGVITATGIVAADPKVLPIGSIIEIKAGPYSGIYTVMDTGGDVKGDKIDIFIPDYTEAVRFGARRVAVKVIRRGWNPQESFANAG